MACSSTQYYTYKKRLCLFCELDCHPLSSSELLVILVMKFSFKNSKVFLFISFTILDYYADKVLVFDHGWCQNFYQNKYILFSIWFDKTPHCKCLCKITGWLEGVSEIFAGKTCNICRDFPAICKYYRVFPADIAETPL